jgi:hypothetical protein
MQTFLAIVPYKEILAIGKCSNRDAAINKYRSNCNELEDVGKTAREVCGQIRMVKSLGLGQALERRWHFRVFK